MFKLPHLTLKIGTAIWAQCYKTFYHSNLPPFHGYTIILCHKATLPW